MEAFITEADSMDRGGYLMVTFQTCLSFLVQFEKDQMEANAKSIMDKIRTPDEKKAIVLRTSGGVSLEKLEKMLDDFEELPCGQDDTSKVIDEFRPVPFENLKEERPTTVNLIDL